MILSRLPLLLVLAVVVSGSLTPSASAAVPGHGRGWELVTPSEPISAVVVRPLAHSPDGSRFAYLTFGPMPGSEAGDVAAANLATRGPTGWTTEPLGPRYAKDEGAILPTFPAGFSRDLSTAIWASQAPLTADAPPGGQWALYRRDASGQLTLLVALGAKEPQFVRVSDDGRHVVFTSAEHLLPADAGRATGQSIYEIDGTALRMVDVDASGEPLSPCGATVAARNAVSRSAERVFFTATTGADCAGPERVYMREDALATVEMSESRCNRPDCNAASAVAFAAATPSGSHAFLTTAQQLTDADQDEATDLYRYDVESDELDLLSGTDSTSAQVLAENVVPSDDGARVYFYASGQLKPGQGAEAETNLYLSDEGDLRFLASLPATQPHSSASGTTALLATPVALVSTDSDAHSDVYRYDAGSDAFTRLSSGPVGGSGEFDAVVESELDASIFPALVPPAMHPLSEDGAHAFFSTAERLVPEDANALNDVYEWSSGKLALVSAGTPSDGAVFAGATGDARTVLFRTSASLIGRDRDGGDYDFYAAPIGGGFAEPTATQERECQEPDCRTVRARGALELPSLASTESPRATRRKRLRLARIAAGAGRSVARTGSADAVVLAPGAGLVRVFAWARTGGKERLVASGRSGAIRPGKVEVPLEFAPPVRRRLRHGQTVPIRLVLRLGRERANARLRLLPAGSER